MKVTLKTTPTKRFIASISALLMCIGLTGCDYDYEATQMCLAASQNNSKIIRGGKVIRTGKASVYDTTNNITQCFTQGKVIRGGKIIRSGGI